MVRKHMAAKLEQVGGARKLAAYMFEDVQTLSEQNIDCRPFFYPLSAQPAYASFPTATAARERNSVSYAV